MSDITSFLAAGLDAIGRAAAANPRFVAEGLIAALRRLPAARTSHPLASCGTARELLAQRSARLLRGS